MSVAHDILHWLIVDSALGPVLVARSERGLAAVQIDDDRELLRRELQRRFPGAVLRDGADDAELRTLAGRVIGAIESPARDATLPELPLDLRGTAFQRAVWQALRAIPPGATATYSELAERVGRPAAVRAVAHACAENTLAVVVPCHRAIRRDGTLAGYRWGLERKRALLAQEAGEAAPCT